MNRTLLIFFAVTAIGLTACQKNPYLPPKPAPATGFFPETSGSTWKYRDSLYGEAGDTAHIIGINFDTLTFAVNGGTTDINGVRCYDVTEHSVYHSFSNAYYYISPDSHVVGLLESAPPFGLVFLQVNNDTAKVGYSWKSAPTASPYSNLVFLTNSLVTTNTILEQNITKTVNGKTFTNVTHTGINMQINIENTGFRNIAYYDIYLAKGVGLIEKDAYFYGLLNSVETILDYNVIPGRQ